MRIELAGGKYTYIREGGHQEVLRNGEPWNRNLTGDKFVAALAGEIEALRERLAVREQELAERENVLQAAFADAGKKWSALQKRNEQLDESQAREKALREALEQCKLNAGNPERVYQITKDALK